MHFWETHLDKAPRQSHVVELSPEANTEMSLLLASIARSVARNLEFEGISGNSLEESIPTERDMLV